MSLLNLPWTPENVRKKVEYLRELAGDAERAHSYEDSLYLELLTAIAEGRVADPRGCCKEAIFAADIRFPRFCA